MARIFRVGLIGYRFMGRAHSNAWRQAPRFFNLKANVEMHTICGRDTAGVQMARAQLGWQNATTDWREIVESPLIDIVDISVPNHLHAEIAIAAAKKGLDAYMDRDKVYANLADIARMLEIASKLGRLLECRLRRYGWRRRPRCSNGNVQFVCHGMQE